MYWYWQELIFFFLKRVNDWTHITNGWNCFSLVSDGSDDDDDDEGESKIVFTNVNLPCLFITETKSWGRKEIISKYNSIRGTMPMCRSSGSTGSGGSSGLLFRCHVLKLNTRSSFPNTCRASRQAIVLAEYRKMLCLHTERKFALSGLSSSTAATGFYLLIWELAHG